MSAGGPDYSLANQCNDYTHTLILWLAQGLGSGRCPWAPGTAGTVPGVVLYWFMADLPLHIYISITSVLFLLGIPLCGVAAQIVGRKDPPSVVWDEVVGYLVTMIAVPPNWSNMVLGFALFRLFDIWKPWPIGPIDRQVHGGIGIMLDDLVAGLLAMSLMHLLYPLL